MVVAILSAVHLAGSRSSHGLNLPWDFADGSFFKGW